MYYFDEVFLVQCHVVHETDTFADRTLILNLLNMAGLNDPTGQLVKEIDGWDTWNIDKDRPNELRRMSQEWLEKYVTNNNNNNKKIIINFTAPYPLIFIFYK